MQLSLEKVIKEKEITIAELSRRIREGDEQKASLQSSLQELEAKYSKLLGSVRVPSELFTLLPQETRKSYL
jgi:septal ring factor EnvC (AmiA/AmiB activator)